MAGTGDYRTLRVRSRYTQAVPAAFTSLVLNDDDYGKCYLLSPTNPLTITLPPNGAPAGANIEFLVLVDQTVTVQAKTGGTLIANSGTTGTLSGSSVAFSTSSRKIGSALRCISTGTAWLAANAGPTTMSVT